MFLKNTWYVACQLSEITDKPLGRKVCNEDMVFYKNTDNKVVAVQDFCPHRGAPLSLGRVCNGQLVGKRSAIDVRQLPQRYGPVVVNRFEGVICHLDARQTHDAHACEHDTQNRNQYE